MLEALWDGFAYVSVEDQVEVSLEVDGFWHGYGEPFQSMLRFSYLETCVQKQRHQKVMHPGPDPHPFRSVSFLCSGMRQTSGAGHGGASALIV